MLDGHNREVGKGASGARATGSRMRERTHSDAPPPASDTGVEITAGVHWLRGTAVQDAESVLDWLTGFLGESVVVLDRGRFGYSDGYLVGPVTVLSHPQKRDMGVCVEIPGEACEELGLARLRAIWSGLGLRVSRLDLAIDGAAFTPAELRDQWRLGNVRTRVKLAKNARPDRLWRNCNWHESATGDTFSMGRRTSTQFARCYDSRGVTRFELELKERAAAVAASELLAAPTGKFMLLALGWVRRFVDFVDAASNENPSRQTLLPFWEAFLNGAEKARVRLGGVVRRTAEDVRAWVEHQVAPGLAVVAHVFGPGVLTDLLRHGRGRWGARHLAMVTASEGTAEAPPRAGAVLVGV